MILLLNPILSTSVGYISNTTYVASGIIQIFWNITCAECTCKAFIYSFVAWNCINSNLTCLLIQNYSLVDTGVIPSDNSTFFFRQMPSEPLVSTSGTTQSTYTALSNGTLGFLSDKNATGNSWTQASYKYQAMTSTNVTLQIILETNKKDEWNVDDISVRDSSSNEHLINGDFESNPSSTGWTINTNGCSSSDASFSSSLAHSASHSYHDACDGKSVILTQSFAVTGGNLYTISLSYYYSPDTGGGSSPVRMTIAIN
ncbi:unnamed protein product [Adineta ricciae]|uniref:Uncharacterized protein n=1 Tax=Adineta ricciae TaxID=249248 RepID=A0A815QKP3_ADIRI|nr:unnamed protein product [Adineta ricciae]